MSQSRKRKRKMNFFQQQMILFSLTLIKVIDTVTLSDKQLLITLHNYGRTWNEALAVCQQENGTLFIEDSYERSIVLQKYKSFYAISQHMWIGLHYPLVGNNNVFGWAGICMWQDGGYTHYKAAEPKNTATSKCVLSDKTTGDWITGDCSSNELFVCQTQRGPCTFDSSSTGKPTPSTSFTEIVQTNIDASACKTSCMTMTNNNENCWGLNFDQSLASNNCFLYFTTDPFYLEKSGVLGSSVLTIYKKRCYTPAKDTVDNTPVTSDNSNTPSTACSSYSSQLLTSTSVSTTTNSLTSSTVTSSSATTATTTPTTSVLSSSETTTTPTTAVPSSNATTINIETSDVPTSTSSTLADITSSNNATTSASTITSSTSPVSNMNSSTAATTSNASMCLCNCSGLDKYVSSLSLDPLWNNLTVEEKVNYLVVRLRVEKTNLSSTVRKKTSAQDDRPVTKSVGYVAIVILVVMLGLLVLSDAINFLKYVKRRWKHSVSSATKVEQKHSK